MFGAVILGRGGTMAAITGYQSAELRKERMELEMLKAAGELEKVQKLLANTQTEYASALSEFQKLQNQLAALKRDLDQAPSVPEPARASLERTIDDTNAATIGDGSPAQDARQEPSRNGRTGTQAQG